MGHWDWPQHYQSAWNLWNWLRQNEYVAVWIEGIALLLIFFWDRLDARHEHRQTLEELRLTREQANAATQSTKAFITSERAWVLVETADLIATTSEFYTVAPVVRNFGKTIARVRKVSIGAFLVLKGQEGTLPPTPTYVTGIQDLDFVLYPGRDFRPVKLVLGSEGVYGSQMGTHFFLLYGLVEYLDLAEEQRFSGFCLVYSPEDDEFVPYVKAPAGYTRYN